MIQNIRSSIDPMLDTYQAAILADKVRDADRCQYALCATLWEAMLRDCVSEAIAFDLRISVNLHGMYSCISSADSFAKRYLADPSGAVLDVDGMDRLWRDIVTYANRFWYVDRVSTVSDDTPVINGAFACEVLLRFPKRFSQAKPDTASAEKKFRDIITDDRVFSRQTWEWPGKVVLDAVRVRMRQILIPRSKVAIKKAVTNYLKDWGTFSSGSAFYPTQKPDTSRIPALKYAWAVLVDGDSFYKGRPLCANPTISCEQVGLHVNIRDKYSAKVMAVPKDYEQSRMIAPETPTLNREASRVRRLLLELTTATGAIKQMPPEDQSLNRERAREGSEYARRLRLAVLDQVEFPDLVHLLMDTNCKDYATIDLSHASDSIVRALFFAVLPAELHSVIRCALTDRLYVPKDGTYIPTEPYVLATSGSVLTPILQSCFYLALAWYACDLCECSRDNVSVYNDDIICTESVFQTLVELLQKFHLTVNEKKTFHGVNLFRESCGGEYIAGVDVTGVYWPRKALRLRLSNGKLDAKSEDIATVVSLQHKLIQFPSVKVLLTSVASELLGSPTFSPVGSDTEDLWSDYVDAQSSLRSFHWSQRAVWQESNSIAGKPFSPMVHIGKAACEHMAYYKSLELGSRHYLVPYRDGNVTIWHTVTEDVTSGHAHSTEIPSVKYVKVKPFIRE